MADATIGDLFALVESMARQQGWLPDDELVAAVREVETARRTGTPARRVHLSPVQLAIGARLVDERDAAERAAERAAREAQHEADLYEYHERLIDSIAVRAITLPREIDVDRSRGVDTSKAEAELADVKRLSGLPADELRRETASIIHMRLLGLDGDGTALARLMDAVGPYPMVSDTHPVREEV